jgi:hypothetical protein
MNEGGGAAATAVVAAAAVECLLLSPLSFYYFSLSFYILSPFPTGLLLLAAGGGCSGSPLLVGQGNALPHALRQVCLLQVEREPLRRVRLGPRSMIRARCRLQRLRRRDGTLQSPNGVRHLEQGGKKKKRGRKIRKKEKGKREK